MCTVTFILRRRGYCLGMNRDEKLTRPAGVPPRRQMMSGRAVIYPSESGGGTWIAVNDHGATLAPHNFSASGKAIFRRQSGLAAPPTSLPFTARRPILKLYAPPTPRR